MDRNDKFQRSLSESLREARLQANTTQTQLARKLGLGQRQISDLERAAMDPRLSTIQNVARALDLELMLIPRQLISAVESLQRAGARASSNRPMYALGNDDDNLESGGTSHAEVGADVDSRDSIGRQAPRPKGRRWRP